jgi:hypothetical protein
VSNSPYGPSPYGPKFPPPGPPLQPPAVRKKKSPLLIGGLGCLGVLVVFMVIGTIGAAMSGGGATGTTVSPAPAASAAKAKASKKPVKRVPGIGDEVRDGKFAFKVTSVKTGIKRVGNQYFGQDAQGQFVEVRINVSNISNKPQTFFDSNQKLFVGNQQYDADGGASFYLPNSRSLIEPINPGNKVAGTHRGPHRCGAGLVAGRTG